MLGYVRWCCIRNSQNVLHGGAVLHGVHVKGILMFYIGVCDENCTNVYDCVLSINIQVFL